MSRFSSQAGARPLGRGAARDRFSLTDARNKAPGRAMPRRPGNSGVSIGSRLCRRERASARTIQPARIEPTRRTEATTTAAHAADLFRRRERRAPDCGRRPQDAGRHVAIGRCAHGRLGVLQVRELAARRRLQVPRRLQRAVAFHPRRAHARRRHLLVRQPRAGDRARRTGARHPARHRHAVGRAGGETDGHRGLRRPR